MLEAIGRDETLLDPTELFKAEAKVGEIDQEDAAYWNVEEAMVTVQGAVDDESDPLIAAALELGATITRVDPADFHTDVPERLIESRQRDADPVTAYLETVHLIADELLWAKQRAELLMLLDGGTVDEVATWLTEQHIVFPGFEREVATRVMALAGGHSETMSTLYLVKPSQPARAPKRQRERDPLVFPQRSSAYEDALTHQLALF